MMWFMEYPWWSYLLLLLAILIPSFFLIINYIFTYWERRGLISAEGSPPWGSLKDFILSRKSIGEVYSEIYNKGEGHPVIGYYSFFSPSLVIRDPELVKNVLVMNYEHFSERGFYSNRKIDPLSLHLFSAAGSTYKEMRSRLSPAYSTSKLRFMFESMKACSNALGQFLWETAGRTCDGVLVEIKKVTNTYGLNVMSSIVVGVEHTSFTEENPLADATFKVTDPKDLMQGFRFILSLISPRLARLLNMRFTPQGVSDFYIDLIGKLVTHRKNNNVVRKDFLQVLLNSNQDIEKSKGSEGCKPLTIDEMAAHTFLFILAGHESISASLCFLLYELALNENIQKRLHDEIDAMDGDITYENINDLTYLDMVFNETLRKYPPGPILIRLCVKDFTLPNGFVIESGTQVIIPVHGLQTDPKFFPEPDKFDPERFNRTSPSHTVEPFTYIPFGDGPRYCIGQRFGILSAKLAVINMLSKLRVERDQKTRVPMELEKKTFAMNPYNGLKLKFFQRNVENLIR